MTAADVLRRAAADMRADAGQSLDRIRADRGWDYAAGWAFARNADAERLDRQAAQIEAATVATVTPISAATAAATAA